MLKFYGMFLYNNDQQSLGKKADLAPGHFPGFHPFPGQICGPIPSLRHSPGPRIHTCIRLTHTAKTQALSQHKIRITFPHPLTGYILEGHSCSLLNRPHCCSQPGLERSTAKCKKFEWGPPYILKNWKKVNRSIFFFLEWQPCHSPVMVFCSSRGIYLGFSQCQLWGRLVFLSPISNYFKMVLEMAQLSDLTYQYQIQQEIWSKCLCSFKEIKQ